MHTAVCPEYGTVLMRIGDPYNAKGPKNAWNQLKRRKSPASAGLSFTLLVKQMLYFLPFSGSKKAIKLKVVTREPLPA